MNLTINGEARSFASEQLTVSTLLGELGLRGKPVVIELNREPVLPGNHDTTSVPENAELEIITIAAGG